MPALTLTKPGQWRLPYPMAADYVREWTALRALKEFVSNAIDAATTSYSATWADGSLVILDDGPGIPRDGLLFGGSTKDATKIGQFGEGKKLALLVLSRDASIGSVTVETVGFSFTASLEDSDLLNGIGAPSTDPSSTPKILVLSGAPNSRTVGTRITVQCPQELAQALTKEVRYLSEPHYQPPTGTAQIVWDGAPGRIWVGGILVSQDPRLIASYDLPLTLKEHQNRDRTIVATHVLENHIQSTLAHCEDRATLAVFVDHALRGGDLSGPEAFFTKVGSGSHTVRHIFRDLAAERWPSGDVYHTAGHDVDDDALSLRDENWEHITTGLGLSQHNALMNLLGVGNPPRAAKVARERAPERREQTTRWVTVGSLSRERRRNLDWARGQLEAVFGRGCLGRQLRVFAERKVDFLYEEHRCGEYHHGSDTTTILDEALDDLHETLAILFHEHGHRHAARNPEYRTSADRTREFENALDRTAAYAILHLAKPTDSAAKIPLIDHAVWDADALPPGTYLAKPHKEPKAVSNARLAVLKQRAAAPLPRRLLADLAETRMAAYLKEHPGTRLSDLMARHAMQARHFNLLTHPHPAGYRRSHGFTTLPDYRKAEVIGRILGIHAPVVYLSHIAVEGPHYRRRNQADRSWREPLAYGATCAVRDLRKLGGVYAEQADAIEAIAAGRVEYDAAGVWLEPVNTLIRAEVARLA